MKDKKKRIITTSIFILSLFAILLGSMVISNNYNKESNVNNVTEENELALISINDCQTKVYTRKSQNAYVTTPKMTRCDTTSKTTDENLDNYNCTKNSKESNGKYMLYKWVYTSCAKAKTTTTAKKYTYNIVDSNGSGYTFDGTYYTGSKTLTSTKERVNLTVAANGDKYEYLTYQTGRDCSYVQNKSFKSGTIFPDNTIYICSKLKQTTSKITTIQTTRARYAYAVDNGEPGQLKIRCSSTSGACVNNINKCNVSKGNCTFTVTSTLNNYQVGRTANCSDKKNAVSLTVNTEGNYNFYACPVNSGTTSTTTKPTVSKKIAYVVIGPNDGTISNTETAGSVTMYNSDGTTQTNSGIGSQLSYECNNSSCYTNIAANPASGYIFVKWSSQPNCSDNLGKGNPGYFTFSGIKNIYACFAKSSSGGGTGGGTGGGGTYTPIQEPTVDNNTTVSKNAFFYAKGSEFQGDSIKCGDKVYITTCTNDSDPICEVTSINGKTVSSTTKIRFSNVTSNEKDTGCYQEIKRYIAKKTSYYTDRELTKGQTDISCGEIVTFKKDITSSCVNKSCEVEYNNKTVYINIDYITSDKPACQNQDETKTCETSKSVTNGKGEITVSICKNDDTEDKRNNIVKCADDYELKYKLSNDTCKDNTSDNCYREYVYTCSAIGKPGISASGGAINSNGKGIINVTGIPYGDIPIFGYYVSSGEEPTENSGWSTFNAVNNKFSIERAAGTYFIWAMNNKHKISYPVLAKVYDSDLSTTLATFGVKDSDGNDINVNMSSLDGTVAYNDIIVDSKYALLSNNLIADSIGGFDKLTTSYELSVNSNKIALYATLTSSDASYVTGYEPRTIDLEYGRNVALIKIVNKDGKERCYTFIINRVDDRNNSNLLKNIKLSRGSIDFDPYVTNYDVTISRFTKKVSVNAELDSTTATFITGYEPREVEITEDNQSVVLKVISEAGNIRSYVITFNKKGEEKDTSNSTYLSSLTVPGTMLGFDKETYDYTITVPYETENVPIYAFAESETASVNVGNNTGLKVGNNLIQIEVKNNNKTRVYSLHVIRKESGLDISDSAKLGTLSIKNYNLEFNPDVLDYEVKIKREKTLLITATPESNRADIYMYGNNDLTGFSTVRVKVIAENGLTNIYSIDIQKDAYNKKIEIIAACAGVTTIILVGVIVYIKKKHDKKKEYLEG